MLISVQVVVGGGNNSRLQTEGRPGSAGLTGVWNLVQEFAAIFAGRTVVDRAVGTDVIVFIPEGPCDALGFEEIGEQFTVETFIAEAAIEAFVDSVLPGTAGLDEAGLDAGMGQPFLQEPGNDLRPIVASQVPGRAVKRDQAGQRGNDVKVENCVRLRRRTSQAMRARIGLSPFAAFFRFRSFPPLLPPCCLSDNGLVAALSR